MKLNDLDSHIFSKYPARFKRAEKDAFLMFIAGVFKKIGYSDDDISIKEMKSAANNKNLVVGNPDAKYLFTAHYDTPGKTGFFLIGSKIYGTTAANIVLILLMSAVGFMTGMGINSIPFIQDKPFIVGYMASLIAIFFIIFIFIAIPMCIKNKVNRNDNTSGVLGVLKIAELVQSNEDLREKCGFVLFDNEEWGLLGSGAYKKWCKNNNLDLSGTMVINLDCIGAGDILAFVAKKETQARDFFAEKFAEQEVEVIKKNSSAIFLSDHMAFENSFMVCRLEKSKLGAVYMPNIHTKKDIESDTDKIEQLAENLYKAIS